MARRPPHSPLPAIAGLAGLAGLARLAGLAGLAGRARALAAACAAVLVLAGGPSAPVLAQDAESERDRAADRRGTAAGADAAAASVRALVTAHERATIASGMPGRIAAMPVRRGEPFAAGDTLVRFDCARYLAERDAGEAAVTAAKAELKSKRRLFELNAIGALEVELAEAKRAQAEARLRGYQVNVERCRIRAPYAGRVADWNAQPHESVDIGDAVIEIVGTERLDLELIVPSAWLKWLRSGDGFKVRIDETGSVHPATVRATGAAVDAVSQTVTVYGRFDTPPDDLVPGMSGVALFEKPGGES